MKHISFAENLTWNGGDYGHRIRYNVLIFDTEVTAIDFENNSAHWIRQTTSFEKAASLIRFLTG